MSPEAGAPEEFVILASLTSRREAERTVFSLGHEFRRKARNGHGSAVVVTGNSDGSMTLTQSRAVTAGDLTAALIRASIAWMAGFLGLVALARGAKSTVKAGQVREAHVGHDDQAVRAILAEAGPHAALVAVRCDDQPMSQEVCVRVAERHALTWQGTLTDFLRSLDPGSQHDWVRKAVGVPT